MPWLRPNTISARMPSRPVTENTSPSTPFPRPEDFFSEAVRMLRFQWT
ncbi:hypothetical protein ACFOPN_04715 [Xanthomonas hyacinthi]